MNTLCSSQRERENIDTKGVEERKEGRKEGWDERIIDGIEEKGSTVLFLILILIRD